MATDLRQDDERVHGVELLPSESNHKTDHVTAKPNEFLAISYGKVSLLRPSKRKDFLAA